MDEDDTGIDEPTTDTTDQPTESVPAPTPIKTVLITAGNGGKVNIRVGNGTKYGRISAVASGTSLPYIATAADGWNAVVIGSQVGWVSGKYSKVVEA